MNRNRWTTFIAMLVAISGCTVLFFKKTELSALVQSACQKLIHLCSIQSSIYSIPPAVPERASINSNSSAAILKSEGLQPSEEPAPSRRTKGTSSLQEIKKLIEKDDICQLIQSKTIFDLDKTDLARLLDEKLTTPSKLLSDPSQLASPADDDLTRKFLYAIYLGGLLEGSPHPKELQLNESYRLLSQLAQSEPRNGSYLYYRAAIRSKLKHPSDKIKEDLIDMAEAPLFETPILNVSKEIHQWGLQSPSQYLLGTLVLKDLSSPNYLTTYDLIKEYLNASDERFRELIFEWGQRVSRRHADASSKREFVYWFALEYQIETALSRLAWMKLHPDQEVPKELPKSYKDLFDRDPHQDQWVKALNDPEHCKESAFHDLLESQIQYEESWSPSQ